MAACMAACGSDSALGPGSLPPSSEIAVDLHTDNVQYRIGGSARLTMVNRSSDTVTLGACNDVLERLSWVTWEEIPPREIACLAAAIVLTPGDSATLPLDLRQATAQGRYRVRRHFSVARDGVSATMYRRSNVFTMLR